MNDALGLQDIGNVNKAVISLQEGLLRCNLLHYFPISAIVFLGTVHNKTTLQRL